MSLIIFFIILLVLIIVHEFGHFFSAKRFGVRVDEFGFGFPPKLFSKKYGETEYSFNALPFGGFVKIFGENPEPEPSARYGAGPNEPDFSRALFNKPKWKQAVVLFAGVFANFLLAWLLFSVSFMSGLPMSAGSGIKSESLQDLHLSVVEVLKNSPAETAGLKAGDRVISVKSASEALTEISPETLKSFVNSHPNDEIEIGYVREKSQIQFIKTKPTLIEGTPMLGIAMDMVGIAKLPIFKAFREGMRLTLFATAGIAKGLYTLISEAIMGKGSFASVTGPVGLVSIIGTAYKFGFAYLLSFTALISLNLAILNLLPFPALDGGRLFFLLIEKVKGSRINPKFANAANMIGFALLIVLMLAVTYHDIVKLF